MNKLDYIKCIYGDALFSKQDPSMGIVAQNKTSDSERLGRICVRVHSIADALVRTVESNQEAILESMTKI